MRCGFVPPISPPTARQQNLVRAWLKWGLLVGLAGWSRAANGQETLHEKGGSGKNSQDPWQDGTPSEDELEQAQNQKGQSATDPKPQLPPLLMTHRYVLQQNKQVPRILAS